MAATLLLSIMVLVPVAAVAALGIARAPILARLLAPKHTTIPSAALRVVAAAGITPVLQVLRAVTGVQAVLLPAATAAAARGIRAVLPAAILAAALPAIASKPLDQSNLV